MKHGSSARTTLPSSQTRTAASSSHLPIPALKPDWMCFKKLNGVSMSPVWLNRDWKKQSSLNFDFLADPRGSLCAVFYSPIGPFRRDRTDPSWIQVKKTNDPFLFLFLGLLAIPT